jgi:hypothetical protein
LNVESGTCNRFPAPWCSEIFYQGAISKGKRKVYITPRMAQAPFPLIARAHRFPIAVPVHFRMSGISFWDKGASVNISRTGILFYTENAIPEGSVLDLEVALEGMTLAFQGSVVRSMESTAAVKFHRHNLSRATN